VSQKLGPAAMPGFFPSASRGSAVIASKTASSDREGSLPEQGSVRHISSLNPLHALPKATTPRLATAIRRCSTSLPRRNASVPIWLPINIAGKATMESISADLSISPTKAMLSIARVDVMRKNVSSDA
jgi:hypothetical protein